MTTPTAAADGSLKTTPHQGPVSQTPDATQFLSILEGTLLQLEDLPPGWTEVTTPAQPDPVPDLPSECRAFYEGRSGAVESETRKFEGPDLEKITSDSGVLKDASAAQRHLAELTTFFNNCRSAFEEAYKTAFEAIIHSSPKTAGARVLDVRLARLSLPQHGDEQTAFRLTAVLSNRGISVAYITDGIDFHVGRVGTTLKFFTVVKEPDAGEEQRLLALIEQRLASAAAELE